MRVVSLACSNTEIVSALGCAHLLVGADSHSDFPMATLSALPRVGPDLEIDVAQVLQLEPDLVLASLTVPGHETVVEGVEQAGLPVLTLDPTSLAEVYQGIRDIAMHLDVMEAAEGVIARMERELAPLPPSGREPSILIQWWPKPVIAPCGRSWADDVLRAAGAVNPLQSEARPSRPLTDEEVAALAPDAIVIAWCGVEPVNYRPDVVYRNPIFESVPAVRRGRVFCIPEAWLGRPGPRLVEGARALRQVVRAITA